MVDPSAFLMDVIGSHRIIQHPQAEAFFCLIEPVIPVASILGKLQKKLFLVAAVGDVPHQSWNVVSICSCHSYTLVFAVKRVVLRQNMGLFCPTYLMLTNC